VTLDKVADITLSELGAFPSGDPANGKDIGHFTQVIWAETTHVGCGYTAWYDGSNQHKEVRECVAFN